MKKLMIATLAAAAVGGAYAVQVADYKASVKYVNMQKKTFRVNGVSTKVPVKVVKSTTVKGYLIYDDCACGGASAAEERPAFLVVKSTVTSDGKAKIFPADLLLNFWATTITANDFGKTWEAEGYLFAGMYNMAGVQNADGIPQNPWMDKDYNFGDSTTQGTRLLFGPYNDRTQAGQFVDSWMYHSGFGKAKSDTEESHCGDDVTGLCLQSLSGSVIGGLFICWPNMHGIRGGELAPCLYADAASTTDVITGTWSIKKTTKLEGIALTDAEIAALGDGAADKLGYDLLPFVKEAASKTSNKGKASGLATFEQTFTAAWFAVKEATDAEEEEEEGDDDDGE